MGGWGGGGEEGRGRDRVEAGVNERNQTSSLSESRSRGIVFSDNEQEKAENCEGGVDCEEEGGGGGREGGFPEEQVQGGQYGR